MEFNFFTKQTQYEKEVADAYEHAIVYAKDFGKDLDFSDESIGQVEAILDFYSTDLVQRESGGNPVPEEQIWAMSIWWGVYVGEVLRRIYLRQHMWINDRETELFVPLLYNEENGTFIYPVHKVFKRLQNGREDSIISFYDLLRDS